MQPPPFGHDWTRNEEAARAIVSGAASLITALDETISSKEAMNIILEQADVIDINGQNAKLLKTNKRDGCLVGFRKPRALYQHILRH